MENFDPTLPLGTEKTLFIGEEDVDEYSEALMKNLLSATNYSNDIPLDEYQYFSSFGPFQSKMNDLGQRILDITQNFLEQEKPGNAPVISNLEDVDEVTERFDQIVDVVDGLIEKVDNFSDEVRDSNKSNITVSTANAPVSRAGKSEFNVFHGTNILRPQLQFKDKIDNSSRFWKPIIFEKPNSKLALKEMAGLEKNQLSKLQNPNLGSTPEKAAPNGSYQHPYDSEIKSFKYLDNQLKITKEILFKPLAETNLNWIAKKSKLKELSQILNTESEFAVDLEHHDYRSYQGFTCLMQISTRSQDYIIDTLKLRSSMYILNESFTNPKIVKVFHGADMDIKWLQRDFGIYVVNLFDTGQAARVLEFQSLKLSFLLKHYCGVEVDKKYQLADWRIRPIPDEMMKYAREDTHYLLYVYDRLRNELITKGNSSNNLLLSTLDRSKEVSLTTYSIFIRNEESYLELYNKYNVVFDSLQLKIFAALFNWRDQEARDQDESTRYVLPNHMLFRVGELMPTDVASLLACCNPVPPRLRLNATDIIEIILSQKTGHNENGGIIPVPILSALDKSRSSIDRSENNSPILTHDQLYATAGWMDLIDDEDDRNSDDDMEIVSDRIVKTSPFNAQKFNTSIDFDAGDDSDSDDDEETKETTAAIFKALQFSSLTPMVTNHLQIEKKEPIIKKPENNQETISKEENKEDNDDDDDVPKSMAEIYQISNKNRKRNKDKKKLKEDNPSSEEKKSKNSEINTPKKNNNVTPTKNSSTKDFLNDIGWTKESDESKAKFNPQNSNQKTHQRKQSENNNQNSEYQNYSYAEPNFTPSGNAGGHQNNNTSYPYHKNDQQKRGGGRGNNRSHKRSQSLSENAKSPNSRR